MKHRGRAVAACVILILGSAAGAGSRAGAVAPSACPGVIVVTRLAFGPGTVQPGGTSTARLSGMNCTRSAQSARLMWTGRFSGGSTAGCPVIDPLSQSITVSARASLRAHVSYVAICRAKLLTVSARLTSAKGAVLADKSAVLHIVQAAGCTAGLSGVAAACRSESEMLRSG